jgi:hypothetical protein
MPWATFSRRLSTLSIRKQPISNSSHSSPVDPVQTSQTTDYDLDNTLPIIPPELWLQIIEFLPLESLWFIRGTCQLFNLLALVRAWETIRETEVGVRTFFDSEHEPLSHVSLTPELLSPSLPKSLSLNVQRQNIEYPEIKNVRKATWRVVNENHCNYEDMRMSYRPFTVEIRFPSNIRAGYQLKRPELERGAPKDTIRAERWSVGHNSKSNQSKLLKLFSSKNNVRMQSPWPLYQGATPEWSVGYVAEYGVGRNDEGKLVHQLVTVTLREVSLPISQIVCTLIDALKYSDSTALDGE